MRPRSAGAASAASFAVTNPVTVPLLINELGQFDGFHWTTVTQDARVRHNAYFGSDGNTGAYFTRKFALGPQGSLWGCGVSYAGAPDGGKFTISLGSVASPNPDRGGVDDAGTLTDNTPTYLDLGTVDSYNPAFSDLTYNSYLGGVRRMIGADGAPLTSLNVGTDAWTGATEMNGGAGVYSVKVRVNGKNAASTNFFCRLTGLVFWRVDDSFLL